MTLQRQAHPAQQLFKLLGIVVRLKVTALCWLDAHTFAVACTS